MDDQSGTGPLGQGEFADGMDAGINQLITDMKVDAAPGSPDPFSTVQPTLVINMSVQIFGEYPNIGGGGNQGLTIGAIRSYGWNFDPLPEADVDGDTLPIAQNTAFFSLTGTAYGGDGRVTFGLPDLEGQLAVGSGQGPGLTNRTTGQQFGNDDVTLALANLPGSVNGGGQDFNNVQPSQAVVWAINTEGIIPSPSTGVFQGQGFRGQVQAFAVADDGGLPAGWVEANGQILAITSNVELFSPVGTTYGGDGRTSFGLPDLRGRTPVGEGRGTGLDNVRLGEKLGSEDINLTASQINTLRNGGAVEIDNLQPSLGLTPLVSLTGLFPTKVQPLDGSTFYIGEIIWFAGNFAPQGFAKADGQLLPINQNQALFSLFGTTYGGDGRTTFALPDLRGRAPVDDGSGFTLGARLGVDDLTLTQANIMGLVEERSLVVTTTDDVVDATDMETSLREAIAFANADPDHDVITFAAGTGQAFETGGTIILGSTLDITSAVTIEGDVDADGSRDITLDGGMASRILSLGMYGAVELNSLVFQNGLASFGGALSVDGILGSAVVRNSFFTGNTASSNGGAISSVGRLSVYETTFSNNSASGNGGAISTALNTSSSDIFGSTFTLNSAGTAGGALHVDEGTLTLQNSTVAGNTATLGFGGGINVALVHRTPLGVISALPSTTDRLNHAL